ncbi:MAG: DUF4358 domain-containing protein [Clostridia bacterium]|nr:DUF4358 domain-containing protein [Clostridia bacterium]
MKRVFSIILVLALAASAVMLASCGDNTAESGTEETKTEEITVPDVTLHYVAAVIYADQVTAEANELKAADNSNLSGWFNETLEFDENLLVKIPEAFSYVDSYVLRISQGQYIEEVDVFKAKDQADTGSIKPMVDYRCNKQKNNNDFKLYDDENGTNAKMMDTGKVVIIGNYVVYAVTENTEVSILRAQKYVQDHPDCSAFELYKAIVTEE